MVLFFVLAVWSVVGMLILATIAENDSILANCPNSDFLCPFWIYSHYNLNWFGTIVVCLLFNALCPMLSMGYWICKLCTFGRK